MTQQTYTVQTGQQSFGEFLYNSRTGEVLGRNGASWAKIFAFYCVYYSFLAGFMSAALAVFMQTISYELPKYSPGAEDSLLRNPALGFRPLPPADRIESSLVWFDEKDPTSYKHYVNSLDHFVQRYQNASYREGFSFVDCATKKPDPKKNELCDVNPDHFGDCNVKNNFGYHEGKPCVFLKLNKMIGWVPKLYETEEDFKDDKAPEISEAAKDVIRSEAEIVDGKTKFAPIIYVTCEGENRADEEYQGHLQYLPNQGFPNYYYPYNNQDGYLPPVIAVQFMNIKRNVLVNMECKVWARNLKHVRKTKLGIAHFELLVDNKEINL